MAKVEYLEGTEFQKSRAFSPAVITEGGRTVWLAGQTATQDAAGKDIAGNFDAQTRRIFELMDATLQLFGAGAHWMTINLFSVYPNMLLAILPPGAFLGLGLMIAAKNVITARRERRAAAALNEGSEAAAPTN